MKQLKYFKIRLDKGFRYDSEKGTVKVYLPDVRLYFDFEVTKEVLERFRRANKFPEVEDYTDWRAEIVSRLEDDNIFYIVCPFASEEKVPSISELIIFDIFSNEMTARRVCQCFNKFHDQFLLKKPIVYLVDKVKKEMTASNFTVFYNLKESIFRIFYTNSQNFVFTVLSANSLPSFIMKIQELLTETDTKYWLKTINYDINPKVSNELLDSPCKLSTIQSLILHLTDPDLPKAFTEFISENLFTSKIKDIETLMSQRNKKLKFTNSDLLNVFNNERVSVKADVCSVLTED